MDSDPDSVSLGHRSRIPIPNIPSPLDTQTNWSDSLPLPTPEDRMRSQSLAVMSCMVPIDVTGKQIFNPFTLEADMDNHDS